MTVLKDNQSYLRSGAYEVKVGKGDVQFKNTTTGGSTYEKPHVLRRLVNSGAIKFEPENQ